jgi:hypothetical protein
MQVLRYNCNSCYGTKVYIKEYNRICTQRLLRLRG